MSEDYGQGRGKPAADGRPDSSPGPGETGTAAPDSVEVMDGNWGEEAGLSDRDLADLAGGAELARQRDEYLDTLRRVQADFDNYRKRVERQQREMADHAATSLVKKLLPVLDTAELAVAHGGGEDVKQVEAALFDVLSKDGLERILPQGEPFDPEVHDAVAHEPAEGEGAPAVPEVSEVLRAGYRWKGHVMRPAMVKVRG